MAEVGTETDREIERETERQKSNQRPQSSDMQQVQVAKKSKNLFWISVSGYQLERAGLVYRFFIDIGHVVDKNFTKSNLMYLKYSNIMDCEIALSYDGQKIGYGGDILVRVKPENPMLKRLECDKIEPLNAINNNEVSNGSPSPICVIEMENDKAQNLQQIVADTNNPIVLTLPRPNRSVPKMGFLQWLKQKVSNMFHYY